MGKLVSVVSGEIFDVAVDLRPGSATFGQWHGVILTGTISHLGSLMDSGHGFQVLSNYQPVLFVAKVAANNTVTSKDRVPFGIGVHTCAFLLEYL
ncbi:hypothetical protein COOONC_23150 [Cooperia oncophora]